jgi:hypothetical protein
MGPLPWYQPVRSKHPQATVLAEHPTATCVDGKEKQPLIAVRPYGRGEVVYLGFNETWRLRRKFGERYYRQFWGQMIERLALNHALGDEKRFVVRTDRRHYQIDEPVTVTIEAFSKDFEPMGDKDLLGEKLQGELLLPAESGGHGGGVQPLAITQRKKGLFEARFNALVAGQHRLRVTDPVTAKPVEWTFQVLGTPVERQQATRNVELQKALALETGGRDYDLKDAGSLAGDLRAPPKTEKTIEVISLTSTWLCFGLLAGLLVSEWLVRKWVNLT